MKNKLKNIFMFLVPNFILFSYYFNLYYVNNINYGLEIFGVDIVFYLITSFIFIVIISLINLLINKKIFYNLIRYKKI